MDPQAEDLYIELNELQLTFIKKLNDAQAYLSGLMPTTVIAADFRQLPLGVRLLAEGLYVKCFAEWERFIRMAINVYFEAAKQHINLQAQTSDLLLAQPLVLYALQSKYQLISKGSGSVARLSNICNLKRELSSRPVSFVLEEDGDHWGSMLDSAQIRQRLLLLGCDYEEFDIDKIKIQGGLKGSQEEYDEFIKKRDRLAHGKDAALTYDDLKRLIVLLSGLADQLIDLLADAFEKRHFAR